MTHPCSYICCHRLSYCISRYSTYALEVATLELEIINISSATESKRFATYRLKTNYFDLSVTVPKSISINFFLNTCNFHRKFRFIFSLNISENTQNVHFREAKFQNCPGGGGGGRGHASGPPKCTLDPIFAVIILNCFRRACYYQWILVSIMLRILNTQKHFSCFSRKGCTFRILQRCILRTADIRCAQA